MSPPSRTPLESLLHLAINWLTSLGNAPIALANVLRWVRFRRFWLKPRPGDIYIITSPKAGTTWAQMIVYQLVTGGQGEFDHIMQVSPFCEQLVARPGAKRLLDTLPSPRILKTHLPYENLKPPADSKILYVTRNPFDTLLSLYHHECLHLGMNMDFEGFFEDMLHQGDPWMKHLESWWPHRKDKNVLHIRYEDLIRDLEDGIRRIAAFLEIPIDESRMKDILEKCSFQYMKQHNDRFDFRMAFYDRGSKGTFIRAGGVGGGRAQLSDAQRRAMEEKVSAFRRRMGIAEGEV